ncbi:hypothetical protein [Saccharothrix sp. ST-888]|nr:hypothetical protein [Saccharothrix sp. ST-888]
MTGSRHQQTSSDPIPRAEAERANPRSRNHGISASGKVVNARRPYVPAA